jgi:hypothetical protein
MWNTHAVKIIQKERDRYSVFNSEEPVRVRPEGHKLKEEGKKDTKNHTDYMRKVEDNDQWRALINICLNLLVSHNEGNFLSRWKNIYRSLT